LPDKNQSKFAPEATEIAPVAVERAPEANPHPCQPRKPRIFASQKFAFKSAPAATRSAPEASPIAPAAAQQPCNLMNKIQDEFQQQILPKNRSFQKHHVPPKIHRKFIQFSFNSRQSLNNPRFPGE
jgi:hypothetical protein